MFPYFRRPWLLLYFFLLWGTSLVVLFWQAGLIDLPGISGVVGMSPATSLDMFFMVLMPLMVAWFFTGVLWVTRQSERLLSAADGSLGTGGFVLGVLALLCPVCNIGLFAIFGIGLNLAFFAPYIDIFKWLSLLLLGYGVYTLEMRIRSGFSCRM